MHVDSRDMAPKVSTGIRLDPDQLDAVNRIAKEKRLTKTAVVRQLIDLGLVVEGHPRARQLDMLERDEASLLRSETNVDMPQELHETELPVVAFAPAGEGRHVEAVPTGELVRVMNPHAREAQRRHWKAVKVVGDSMSKPDGTGYDDGDFLLIEPTSGDGVRDGDLIFCLLNGDPLLKVLRFKKGKGAKMERVTLLSLNPRHQPIPVYPEDDFRIVGTEAYHIARKRNFR